MGFGFRIELKGAYALFSRPELKVERYSYDFITPSAARGILEAIFWKPAIRFVIDKIHVLNEIRFTSIRRNEVSAKAPSKPALQVMQGGTAPLYLASQNNIQQRASLLLKDVHYVIEAHFEMTDKAGESDSPEKFYNMMLRRLRLGQCFHQPYFGCREFPAQFGLCEQDVLPSYYQGQQHAFGLMLYDMDYSDLANILPTFFSAVMQDGTIDLTHCEVYR